MATTIEHMQAEADAATGQAPAAPDSAAGHAETGAPRARGKPREPLSAGTVAGIAAALIAALLTVLGIAGVAAFNALRDDIGQVRTEIGELRTEIGELRTETKDDNATLRTELKGDIETLRTETREQFAEVYVILRDHGERLARIESELRTHGERLTGIEAAHPHSADQ